MTIPRSELQTLSPGALVVLFEVDATAVGGSVTRWSPNLNRLGNNVVFGGNTYTAYPVDASGFAKNTDDALPRPILTVANLNGAVSAMCRTYQDLVGATVTRRMTLEKYLDAVNFPGGVNPTAGAYEYPPETWVIERKASDNKKEVEFELVASCDATGLRLPARKMQANTCSWTKMNDSMGGNCPYVATCPHTLTACKTNFGTTVDLPFGGFPGLLMVRQ